jgi:hypothetical protein
MTRFSMEMYIQQRGGSSDQKQSVPYEADLPTPNFSGSSGWETKKRGGQGK